MKISFEIKVNKYILLPLITLGSVFAAYLYATPYLAILAFKSAIESKDTEEARKYINFPSVRASLKDQLTETLTKKINKDLKSSRYSGLKLVIVRPIVGSIVNSTIDATVTPNGLRALIKEGKFSRKKKDSLKVVRSSSNSEHKSNIQLYYKSFNRFVLRSDIANIDEPMKVYWKRSLIFDWKLTSIELPFELMNTLE